MFIFILGIILTVIHRIKGPKHRAGKQDKGSILSTACMLVVCEHHLHKQREPCLFEELPRIQREAADLTRASGFTTFKRKSYFERPLRAGKLQARWLVRAVGSEFSLAAKESSISYSSWKLPVCWSARVQEGAL